MKSFLINSKKDIEKNNTESFQDLFKSRPYSKVHRELKYVPLEEYILIVETKIQWYEENL